MSLPIPSTGRSASSSSSSASSYTRMDPKQVEMMDGPLIALTEQCGGDLRRLLYAFFGFLHRRTDFYLVHPRPDESVVASDGTTDGLPPPPAAPTMGFPEGDAEKLLIAAFRQFPLRRIAPRSAGGRQQQQQPSPPTSASNRGTTNAPPVPPGRSSSSTHHAEDAAKTNKATTKDGDATKKCDRHDDAAAPAPEPPVSPIEAAIAIAAGEARKGAPHGEERGAGATDDDEEDGQRPGATAAVVAKTSSSNMDGVRYSSDDEDGDDDDHKEDGNRGRRRRLQIPVGNGGSTPRYKWTQTLEEVTVLVGVPDSLRGRDFDVVISPKRLSIRSKVRPLMPGGAEASNDEHHDHHRHHPITFVDGTLVETIRPDESTWTVEGGVMILTLDKVKKTFWPTVIEGDERIDTNLVDSRRHIGDYDEVTQGQIRKTIFDQNQYHKGLPDSDEISGRKPKIPDLPPGVEYIDQKKLDEEYPK
jgi:N-terminal conserved domain of Nudc./CS domain